MNVNAYKKTATTPKKRNIGVFWEIDSPVGQRLQQLRDIDNIDMKGLLGEVIENIETVSLGTSDTTEDQEADPEAD